MMRLVVWLMVVWVVPVSVRRPTGEKIGKYLYMTDVVVIYILVHTNGYFVRGLHINCPDK